MFYCLENFEFSLIFFFRILKILSGPFRTYFLRELTLLDQATDCTEFLRLFITLLIEIVSDVQSPIRRQTAGEMLSSCINGFQLNDTVATELIRFSCIFCLAKFANRRNGFFLSQFISGFVRFRENFESLTDEDSQLWADVCGRLSRR